MLAIVGEAEWRDIGESEFPVWIFVPEKDSVCRPENLKAMVEIVPRARVLHFPGALHSIHNSRTEDFVNAIEKVYEEVELKEAFEDIHAEVDGSTTLSG